MNWLKMMQTPEVASVFNATVSAISQRMARANPQTDRFPAPLMKNQVKKIAIQHSEQWQTVEMKDGGFAFVFVPKNLIAFYSPQLSDLDVLKLFYDEFVEISMRDDCEVIINKIVELIVKNSELDPLYYATAAGLTGYVGKRLTGAKARVLNEPLTDNGDTPAHVAALHNQDIIKIFLREGFDPLTKTKNGETIAHYGAKHLKVLEAIRTTMPDSDFFKLIIAEDKSKRTALHTALIRNDCMEYLLKYCPQAFSNKYSLPLITVVKEIPLEDSVYIKKLCANLKMFDPNFLINVIPDTKNTILHTALPTKLLKILLSFCDEQHIESTDSFGKTPLHEAVKRNDLEGTLALISYGANVDSVDSAGKTPIHFAVENKNIKSVKALLLFNADVSSLSGSGATSREIREILKCGSKSYYDCESKNSDFDLRTLDHIALKKTIDDIEKIEATQFFNSLAFDGGGMRGLVSLQILREIENRYNNKKNFIESFKSMGGTSTGSILIMAIAKYQNLDKVMRLYLRLKDDIFSGSRPYNGDFLEKRLTEELGTITMSEFGRSKEIRLAVTVTRVDVSPPKLAVFRSFAIPSNTIDSRFTPLEDWSAAKIARCSSAAPSYFPAVEKKYMDGGIIANNPSCEILCDQQTISLLLPTFKSKMKIMLSIGTGQPPQRTSTNVDVVLPGSINEVVTSLNSLLHMKNVFLDQLTSADGVNVDRAKLMASAMGVAFFRFSPPLSQNYELDEIRAEQLVEMMWETKLYMHTRLNDINILLKLLGN